MGVAVPDPVVAEEAPVYRVLAQKGFDLAHLVTDLGGEDHYQFEQAAGFGELGELFLEQINVVWMGLVGFDEQVGLLFEICHCDRVL